MFCRSLLLGLGLGVLLAAAVRSEDPREEVRRLVGQLGSGKYAEREAAGKRLMLGGGDVLAELMTAARDGKDPEVRLRARRLVRKIQRRLEDERTLAGQRVRLQCKDVEALEAVESLATLSGVPLEVDGDRTGLAGRKVTVDTGLTTFWQALDQLSIAAGLAEKGSSPAGRHVPTTHGVPTSPGHPRPFPLLLVDHRPVPRPTFYAGAVRIAALGGAAAGEEICCTLEVAADPSLQGMVPTRLAVRRAVDDAGQALAQPHPGVFEQEMGDRDESAFVAGLNMAGGRWQPTVRLRRGKTPSQVLKELEGTVTIQVRAARPLVWVEEVLGRAGETVRGDEGGALKVLQARREGDEAVRLRLQLESSTDPQAVQLVKVRPGFVSMRGLQDGDADRFVLADDAGRPWRRVEARRTLQDRPDHTLAVEYELLYRREPGQGAQAHLVYSTTRPVSIDVPFCLHNVPLR